MKFHPDGRIEYLDKSPKNNIYLYLPHRLKDPLEDAASKKVSQFYSRSFWKNKPALRCIFAAMALVLELENINR
eukprot:4923624-Karenia_brevis.AAC.1